MKKNFITSELEIKRLGINIRIARERRGINISELATKASVSRQVIMRIEQGDPSVGIAKVFNILNALGLLKGIASMVDPELDRTQAIKEIKDLRENILDKNKTKTSNGKKQFNKNNLDF